MYYFLKNALKVMSHNSMENNRYLRTFVIMVFNGLVVFERCLMIYLSKRRIVRLRTQFDW